MTYRFLQELGTALAISCCAGFFVGYFIGHLDRKRNK